MKLKFLRDKYGEKVDFKWWIKFIIADWCLRYWLRYEGWNNYIDITHTSTCEGEGTITLYFKKVGEP
jgi:hypothetical protein